MSEKQKGKTHMDRVLADLTLNKILDAVLASSLFKELKDSRDVQAEIEFHGYQKRETDAELENLDDFLNCNIEDLLKITSIWEWLKKEIQDDVSDCLTNAQIFIENGLDYNIQKMVNKHLDRLSNELSMILRARLNAKWQDLTPELAKPRLVKGNIYVAIVDADGKLTREPYSITTNKDAKVTFTIEEEEVIDRFMQERRKERKLLVEIDPKVKTPHTNYKYRAVTTLKKGEVGSVVIVA